MTVTPDNREYSSDLSLSVPPGGKAPKAVWADQRGWKLLKWLPVLFLSLFLPLTVQAGDDGERSPGQKVIRIEEMRSLFRQVVSSDLPWNKKDIKIKNFSVDQTDPAVDRGELDYRIVSLVPERFLGRRYLTIIYMVDGRDQLRVKMSGDVHRYGDVFCAARHLPRGTTLEEEHIMSRYRDVTMLGNDLPYSPEQITGKVAKTTLQPGEIIYSRNLEKKELVERGEMVTIIAGNSSLKISVPGEVENKGGALGESVQVKNLMSRRIINARVTGNGVVRAEN